MRLNDTKEEKGLGFIKSTLGDMTGKGFAHTTSAAHPYLKRRFLNLRKNTEEGKEGKKGRGGYRPGEEEDSRPSG